jgi:hypothetical protein
MFKARILVFFKICRLHKEGKEFHELKLHFLFQIVIYYINKLFSAK